MNVKKFDPTIGTFRSMLLRNVCGISSAAPRMPAAFHAPDGGGGGGGGGATKLADLLKDPDFKKEFDAAIGEATTGLVNKNKELLTEKKKLSDQMLELTSKFEGIDLEQVRALMEKFEGDDEAKLIKAGKIDEVIERRAAKIISKHEKAAETAQAEAKKNAETAAANLAKFKREKLNNAIATSVKGLAEGALPKVQRDAAEMFDIDDDGNVVAREGAPLGPGGKPLSLETLTDYLIEASPFYFPSSGGAGGQGGRGQGGGRKPTIAFGDSAALSANLEAVAEGKMEVK